MSDESASLHSRSHLAESLYRIALGCHHFASTEFFLDISRSDPSDAMEGLGDRIETIIRTKNVAINLGDPLSLEALSILELISNLYAEAIERFDCFAGFPEYDASEADFKYAYATLRSDLSWVENYRERLELIAARLATGEAVSTGSRYDDPLTKRAEAVYNIILESGKIIGREIIKKLDERCHEDIGSIDQSTLTKDIVPELKRLRGVKNRPGVGYYDPRHYDPRSSARK